MVAHPLGGLAAARRGRDSSATRRYANVAITVATAPITRSTYSPALAVAENTSSLATNPLVSGIPACASMNSTSRLPITGRREASPRRLSMERSSSPCLVSTVTTANEPITMKV